MRVHYSIKLIEQSKRLMMLSQIRISPVCQLQIGTNIPDWDLGMGPRNSRSHGVLNYEHLLIVSRLACRVTPSLKVG